MPCNIKTSSARSLGLSCPPAYSNNLLKFYHKDSLDEAISKIACYLPAGYMQGSGLPFYAGVTAAGAHMLWQVWSTDLESRAKCMASFVSNKWLGGLIFSGIVLDKFGSV